MIRDITIGQYYPVKSRIHSLDPRVKIICTLLFLVSLFVQSSFLGYVIATLFLGMVIYMSKVPLKYIVKGLKPIVILLMFTVVMNLFLTRGGETLLHFWIFTITEEGVRTSVFMALRLMYLVAGASLFSFSTSPPRVVEGGEKKKKKRAKAMIPILVPLFVSAFRRANDLAMAMEARCYHGGEGRTRMKPLKYNGRDKAAYLITILYAAGVFAVGKFVPFQLWIF